MISSTRILLFGVIIYLSVLSFIEGFGEAIDYEGPTDAGKKKLEVVCREPIHVSCESTTVYGFEIDCYSVVDINKKILMEFTPKADCTSAVVAFFRAMGLELGVDYVGWPHTFRDQHFYAHCGRASNCHYLMSDWFRFKVVRNPFDRAVSNYLHCIGSPHVQKILPSPLVNSSFETFIDYLLALSAKELQVFLYRNAGPQSQPYERFVYGKKLPPIFNVIVKAEDSEKSLQQIANMTGTRYSIRPIPNHYRQRNNTIKHFVGNVSWPDLKGHIPKNYGYFYSKELIKKVERLYRWDLILYGYSYPFELPKF